MDRTIYIDEDKKCVKCGKPWAASKDPEKSGLCLECLTKRIMEGKMNIGQPTIDKIGENIIGLLRDYRSELNEAFMESGDDPLDISCKVRLDVSDGGMKIQTGISFTTKKIKAVTTSYSNENQGELFDKDKPGD